MAFPHLWNPPYAGLKSCKFFLSTPFIASLRLCACFTRPVANYAVRLETSQIERDVILEQDIFAGHLHVDLKSKCFFLLRKESSL